MWEKILSGFDKYSKEARIYPIILSLLPLYLFLLSATNYFPSISIYLKLISGFFFCSLLIYLGSDVVRNLGKSLEAKIFKNELYFPTTLFLLHSNSRYSTAKKTKLYQKIYKEFGISLYSLKKEKTKTNDAKKRIKEVVGLIRQKLGNGRLLLQYNIRYGFWRNLTAFSPISFVLSFFALISQTFLFETKAYLLITLILAPCYLVLWIKRKSILTYFGQQYADQLYFEFLSG